VGLRVGLDTEVRRKILCPCQGSNPDHPARSQTLYCLSYCGSLLYSNALNNIALLLMVVDIVIINSGYKNVYSGYMIGFHCKTTP
jgi:hypothetical protein